MKREGNINNHTEEAEQIELGSENARRFIGEVPPLLVRTGTVIITVILTGFLLAVTLIDIDGVPLWRLVING